MSQSAAWLFLFFITTAVLVTPCSATKCRFRNATTGYNAEKQAETCCKWECKGVPGGVIQWWIPRANGSCCNSALISFRCNIQYCSVLCRWNAWSPISPGSKPSRYQVYSFGVSYSMAAQALEIVQHTVHKYRDFETSFALIPFPVTILLFVVNRQEMALAFACWQVRADWSKRASTNVLFRIVWLWQLPFCHRAATPSWLSWCGNTLRGEI